MANYDEDDVADYDEYDEEFNEDNLNDEDYDKLYEILPSLKASLASYNNEIPDADLKETLYANYFEVEPTIEELKSRFKPSTYIICGRYFMLPKFTLVAFDYILYNVF